MSAEGIAITVLVSILGFSGGIVISHVTAVRKINEVDRQVGEQGRDIKTAFRDIDHLNARYSEVLSQQKETLALLGKIVEQNTFFIQKAFAEKK